jgi:hypothetical protein
MARQMSLSEHAVQDHLKSIFAKTGARDRVTLLSCALGTRPGQKAEPSLAACKRLSWPRTTARGLSSNIELGYQDSNLD